MSDLGKAFREVECEIRHDNLTRQLYATDASIYRLEPLAIAFPRNARQAAAVIAAAAEANLPVTPRGAGSGLVGGALGDGLVVDFARYNRGISNLDLEKRTVRAGAGVVLDQLNRFLKPHGFCFGPDVATSSRATLGGMIANNSSGARTPVYGTTADHVISLEIVMADGRIATASGGSDGLSKEMALVSELVGKNRAEILERMPPGLLKRWPGYGLDRFASNPNLANILAGSEGTLAGITSAELRIIPLPMEKALGLVFFTSATEAMQATVELLDLKPAAIEHIDRVLTDQTKGQLQFQRARDLLELDEKPCESILIVEFYENAAEQLAALEGKSLGLRTRLLTDAEEMSQVWGLRKAGVALLTGCKGPAKPVTGIEDTAVRPERLPEYVAALQALFQRVHVSACFYGHAASGLLHVRPVLDLHEADDLRKFREISNEVSALVRQFKGSIAAEHGVGMARTEYMPEHLGPKILEMTRAIKNAFDPKQIFNPGKILDTRSYKIDAGLRLGPGVELKLPFEPVLAFAAKDESFLRNLEQCNGCGGCRKETPTMCPTFLATGEEWMSTRGRANWIRSALEHSAGGDLLVSPEMEAALSNCLSCKACLSECPSNVNLPLLKAELLNARHERDGLPAQGRLLSSVDWLGRLGCAVPWLANFFIKSTVARRMLARLAGISPSRPLPAYAAERFDRWFESRTPAQNGQRGRVILWDDCFARYYEPQIGRAAVKVLEAAGFEVKLPRNRECCGRPAFSQGNLKEAARLGNANLRMLSQENRGSASGPTPIIFLEPSCYSMFAEDYRELKMPSASRIAERAILFEEFIDQLLMKDPKAIEFQKQTEEISIHAHCHAKSLGNTGYMARLARRLPGRSAVLLESGCCGMAGAFGMLEVKQEISLAVGELLAAQIRKQPSHASVVASGTSCRQQIEFLTGKRPRHMAELIAEGLRAKNG